MGMETEPEAALPSCQRLAGVSAVTSSGYNDAFIVKTYAVFAPTAPLAILVGGDSTVVEESRVR
jgi:hypothetical protein